VKEEGRRKREEGRGKREELNTSLHSSVSKNYPLPLSLTDSIRHCVPLYLLIPN
jgi:hypothetical protein